VDFAAPWFERSRRPSDNQNNKIALRLRVPGSLFFWAMQLLPCQRREAVHALHGLCREVVDIATAMRRAR
jgi:phytoene/squalene synthetase